jgi:hypothetical protein
MKTALRKITEVIPSVIVPVINQLYWAQCEGFRCMAMFNGLGRWNVFSTGKELFGVLDFRPA